MLLHWRKPEQLCSRRAYTSARAGRELLDRRQRLTRWVLVRPLERCGWSAVGNGDSSTVFRRNSNRRNSFCFCRSKPSSDWQESCGDNLPCRLLGWHFVASLVPCPGHGFGGNFLVLVYYGFLDHFSRLSIDRKGDLPIRAIFLFHLRHSNEIPSRSPEDLKVLNRKTTVDGNICVSEQVPLVCGKDPYACDLHEDYESVLAFLIAATHSRSISKLIPSIRQPSAYSSL
jgi:hypothetical protein